MPVLTAAGAGVRHRRRWLFQGLDVSVEPGEILAIVGPPGSGRTTVLLALSRRFKLSAGRVTGSAALGWVPEVTSPEPMLTVLEHIRERLLLIGRSPREAGQVPLLGLDPRAKGFQLSPYERQLLGVVLARLEDPRVIALDAVDEGLDQQETQQLWTVLRSIAGDGIAVLVTARELDPDRVSTVVRLGGSPAAPSPVSDQDPPKEQSPPNVETPPGEESLPAAKSMPDEESLPGEEMPLPGERSQPGEQAQPGEDKPTSEQGPPDEQDPPDEQGPPDERGPHGDAEPPPGEGPAEAEAPTQAEQTQAEQAQAEQAQAEQTQAKQGEKS
jgi:ABC-2 type transport system ATP-binding protein